MHVPRYSRIRRRRRIRPRHRLRNTTALVVVVIITAWCIFASRFLWFPRIDHQPDHVDAIVQLGGPHGGIEAYEKTRRAAIGHTTNLVISDPYIDKPAFGARLCAPEPGITVYCVHPEPSTTRGEARAIEALVKEHGWTHVMVYAT